MTKGFRAKTPGERETNPFPGMQGQMWNTYYRKARQMGKHWKGCAACPPNRRDPEALLQIHHVIEQRRLKRLAVDRKLTALERLRLLTDPRNSMLLCEGCHHRHTVKFQRLPRAAIADYAWDFIRELGLTEEAMADYPIRPSEGNR